MAPTTTTSSRALADKGNATASDIYETMAIDDIREATGVLKPVWDQTEGLDGYVSLEVSPYLGMRTDETIAEAKRLWKTVDRPNLMVKIPGTEPGVPAVRAAIADGINVNVTLLFSLDAYKKVLEAYISGLEERHGEGARYQPHRQRGLLLRQPYRRSDRQEDR